MNYKLWKILKIILFKRKYINYISIMNTSDNSNDDNITTDYNNSESNNYINNNTQTESIVTDLSVNAESWIPSLSGQDQTLTTALSGESNNESIINSDSNDIINNEQNNDPYTQLFVDNPDNPFFKCKINKLEYETDDEETDNYIRLIVTWNYEFNYDFFNILEIKCFITKNNNFKNMLNDVKKYRDDNNTTTTGLLLKLDNNGFKLLDTIHTYLIVYYDNAKCNIELYGIFNQELEEEKLIKNIIDESIYGKAGKIISSTNINSTGGEGFVVIHNLVNIE
jgi:hypothetical protein